MNNGQTKPGYNPEEDYYVCPMGQHMTRVGTRHDKSGSGYVAERAIYRARRCEGCPLRGSCYKGEYPAREIRANHRLNEYKRRARERLTSERGLEYRSKRPTEPEAVFGQMKYNMAYRRFRHFGKDKVTMDFAFFAIAFNIKKWAAKWTKHTQNGGNPTHFSIFCLTVQIYLPENRILQQKTKKTSRLRYIAFSDGLLSKRACHIFILTHPRSHGFQSVGIFPNRNRNL